MRKQRPRPVELVNHHNHQEMEEELSVELAQLTARGGNAEDNGQQQVRGECHHKGPKS